MNKKKGGLYIHIPYCRHKCLYCDFYTGGLRIAEWDKYVDCLLNELMQRKDEFDFEIETLYLGGGTPSLIPVKAFLRLMEGINSLLGKSDFKEFTLEANPEDVTDEKIKVWKDWGVNRVSLGVQTLIDSELKSIGRWHDSRSSIVAIEKLRREIGNVSVDVMFGIPGQTVSSYLSTLKRVLKVNPTHISSYALMLEEGTAMTQLYNSNRIFLPSESEWLEMYEATINILKGEGYERYEISNYSKPGKESCHNLSYWEGKPYIGLGPGAHSFDGGKIRKENPNDLKGYLRNFSNGGDKKFYIEEFLKEDELREEMILTRLRTSKGLNLKEFADTFGDEAKEKLLQNAQNFIFQGKLQKSDDFICFTDAGFSVSDSILVSLI
ncbi:MAG: radical SAM family heme chaperone HemW [Muribaculaceae bacterium]|nr:radical SAM family heme chaperone HemW [Muribaculaceae bacterium]